MYPFFSFVCEMAKDQIMFVFQSVGAGGMGFRACNDKWQTKGQWPAKSWLSFSWTLWPGTRHHFANYLKWQQESMPLVAKSNTSLGKSVLQQYLSRSSDKWSWSDRRGKHTDHLGVYETLGFALPCCRSELWGIMQIFSLVCTCSRMRIRR